MFSSGWPPKLSLLLLVKSYSVFIYYYLRSFYTTGYGPNTLDKFAMSEDLKFIKVKTSNWNEFVFRFRSILEKHRLLDTISNDAVIRAAAVVQEALLDDFAAAGAGGVMEMSTYDQNRYKVASALYDKYDKGVTEARNFIQGCTDDTTYRIIRDIPFNDHYARFIALQRALQSTTTTAV